MSKLDPKLETRKLLLRLIQAIQGGFIEEELLEGTLDSCVGDLELIWSGNDTGARWSIGSAELMQGFKNDPELGLDADGNVILKKKQGDDGLGTV